MSAPSPHDAARTATTAPAGAHRVSTGFTPVDCLRRAVIWFACGVMLALLGTGGLGPAPAQAAAPTFGIASFAVTPGSPQAGAHGDLTTEFTFNAQPDGEPVQPVKDVQMSLPAGTVGDALATPRCSPAELQLFACQPSSQVGVMNIGFFIGKSIEPITAPLYDITPTPGHVATLASSFLFELIVMQVDMSKDGTYRLSVGIPDVSALLPVTGVKLALWGVPASPAHDLERFRTQLGGPQLIYGPPNEFGEQEVLGVEPTPAGVTPVPFLTNSTDCAAANLPSTLSIDSYLDPGDYVTQTVSIPAPTGCERLHIAPNINVKPETTQQDNPTGYEIDLGYPLNEDPYGLATPDLKQVSITLPPGTSLSPAAADGLQGCSEEQLAGEGCPSASKVGTVEVRTPLLPAALTGIINLAAPTPAAMYRVFVSASGDNVTVHLIGQMHLDPNSGQVTLTFREAPQLPFSELKLHLFGGPEAVMANPTGCGPATTSGEFVSYGGQAGTATSTFNVDANGAGGACQPTLPFAPHVTAGTTSPLAATFSPFTLTASRQDGEQQLATLTAQLPPGLLGVLSQVPVCPEPQASQGACPPTSQIGTTTLGAGAGTHPFYLSGTVYLTGPYKGAPFGLAIVVPAIAGPYHLGTIVVRAQVLVAPGDLHITIASDPLPHIVAGIPLRLRTVQLSIGRPGFMFNPTNCSPKTITTTLGSTELASAITTTPFQSAGCRSLGFAPTLTASTQAQASRRGNGATLQVAIATAGANQANIRAVRVEVPTQLRPRLNTIQGACPSTTFAANPGSCPATALIGTVAVTTPVLASVLTGPIYLVARGTAFPDIMMVAQGGGIRLELAGTVAISKKGTFITEFSTVPDAPVTALSLTFASGSHSLLGAITPLCATKPNLPYTITGQNGDQIRRTVRMKVTGCATRRPRTVAHRAQRRVATNVKPGRARHRT